MYNSLERNEDNSELAFDTKKEQKRYRAIKLDKRFIGVIDYITDDMKGEKDENQRKLNSNDNNLCSYIKFSYIANSL